MLNIFEEEWYWKGKLIIQTYHFKEELENVKKPFNYILDILDYEEHILVSKKTK